MDGDADEPRQRDRDDEIDTRFTFGLIDDVFSVLEEHSYQRTANVDRWRAIRLLFELVEGHEGRADSRRVKAVVRAAIVLVVVAAFSLSFQSLMKLGELASYGPPSFLYPVCVDLGTVASCSAWLATKSREAFWLTWLPLALPVIQNGTVHWLLATGQRPEWWLVTLVGAAPPAVPGAAT